MYKINIVCVGKLKEDFYLKAQSEYAKRLQKFCELKIFELPENYLPQNPSRAQIESALDSEYNQILPKLRGKVFVCDVEAKQLDSVQFSSQIIKSFDTNDTITFVIGSSYGLSQKIKQSNSLISFSKMTFPHHLMRVLLLEQIYRGFCINSNTTYHK